MGHGSSHRQVIHGVSGLYVRLVEEINTCHAAENYSNLHDAVEAAEQKLRDAEAHLVRPHPAPFQCQ